MIWMLGFLALISFVATQAIELLTAYAPHLWGLDLVAITAHDFLLAYSLPFLLAFVPSPVSIDSFLTSGPHGKRRPSGGRSSACCGFPLRWCS